jgi:hypothetical protein
MTIEDDTVRFLNRNTMPKALPPPDTALLRRSKMRDLEGGCGRPSFFEYQTHRHLRHGKTSPEKRRHARPRTTTHAFPRDISIDG